MAWYEISIDALAEAGDKFKSFADGLNALRERFDGILAGLPESLRGFQYREQKQISENISGLCLYAGTLKRALSEIAEVCENAERLAFSCDESGPKQLIPTPRAQLPRIRKPSSLLLRGDLIMPGWLAAALLKYMQSDAVSEPQEESGKRTEES
jgi:hypothetical protein